MSYPMKKKCLECGDEFETVCDSDVCTQCLVRPLRVRRELGPIQPPTPPTGLAAEQLSKAEESTKQPAETMDLARSECTIDIKADRITFRKKGYKPRQCTFPGCNRVFTPTGSRQELCTEHKGSQAGHVHWRKKLPVPPPDVDGTLMPWEEPAYISQQISIEAIMVVRILLATGAINRAALIECIKAVREFKNPYQEGEAWWNDLLK